MSVIAKGPSKIEARYRGVKTGVFEPRKILSVVTQDGRTDILQGSKIFVRGFLV